MLTCFAFLFPLEHDQRPLLRARTVFQYNVIIGFQFLFLLYYAYIVIHFYVRCMITAHFQYFTACREPIRFIAVA